MMALVAAVSGLSTYMAGGSVWMTLGRVGLMMASTLLTPKNEGPTSSESGNTVPALDPGLGFAAFPQYPTPEMPVPVIYGQARLNALVVHSRIYGSDYQKVHYLAVFGEVGLSLDQLYVDKYRIEDLPNYYSRTSGSQDANSSWYNFNPQGGVAQISLNNSGTWNIFQVSNAIGDIAAVAPVIFYGGGTLLCYSYHTWPKEGSSQSWKWVLTNINNPTQTLESEVFSETFQSTQDVSCFPSGSRVLLPDGSEKAIEALQVGDLVQSFDSEGTPCVAHVTELHRHEQYEEAIHITTRLGVLVSTDAHFIKVKSGGNAAGYLGAHAITPDHVLLDAEGRDVAVLGVERIPEEDMVTWGVVIGDTEAFIVNGIRVHNGKGKDSSTVNTPGNALRTHQFTVSEPLSRWALKLVVSTLTLGDSGGQIGIYKFDIADVPFSEDVRINASFVHVHLVKDAAIGSNNPTLSALLRASGTTGLGGNPADAMLSFLTDPVIGLGLPGSILDMGSQFATAYWCEQHGLGFNRAYAAFYDAEQVFREICAAGRIMTLVRDGRITLKPDDLEPASYKVGETETLPGSIRIGIQSTARPNRIEAQYVEPFYGHTVERLYVEDLDAIAREGLQTQTIDLTGVTDQTQAYKLAWFVLRTIQDCPYWCKFKVGMETARILPLGGVIEIESSTNPLIGTKQWRVLTIEETEEFVYQIECIQYNASVYQEPAFSPWYNMVTELEPIQGWPGPDLGPATVVNLEITNLEFPIGSGSTTVTLDWTTPPVRYERSLIQWSHNGADWTNAGTAVDGPFTFSWPMRYGLLHVRAVSVAFGVPVFNHPPTITTYVAGSSGGGDYPGYGRGQYGWQPYGY
ncbi:MAG: hypothetical protein HQL79_07455 [Magnetococcales bacterium]|nr:hypothetical protein [Magnetococcales bacterium]